MSIKKGDTVKFIKQKDYEVINENLGSGSFGKTVLIKDTDIDELFVVKKYEPESNDIQTEFYDSFLKEIKILHKLYHVNVVRVFNYYLFPTNKTGYILMEFIEGENIEQYLSSEIFSIFGSINKVFIQLIDAFNYLEKNGIVHRDIRSSNILVDKHDNVKVIDFGLGKIFEVGTRSTDSLNQVINRAGMQVVPDEFYQGKYTSKTDMFCIAELLNRLIIANNITDFSYKKVLDKMMQTDESKRYKSFEEIVEAIKKKELELLDIPDEDKEVYLNFSNAIFSKINNYTSQPKFNDNRELIIKQLEVLIRENSFEYNILDNSKLIKIFVNAGYSYKTTTDIPLTTIKTFYSWFKDLTNDMQDIVIQNINIKLSKKKIETKDELPF